MTQVDVCANPAAKEILRIWKGSVIGPAFSDYADWLNDLKADEAFTLFNSAVRLLRRLLVSALRDKERVLPNGLLRQAELGPELVILVKLNPQYLKAHPNIDPQETIGHIFYLQNRSDLFQEDRHFARYVWSLVMETLASGTGVPKDVNVERSSEGILIRPV